MTSHDILETLGAQMSYTTHIAENLSRTFSNIQRRIDQGIDIMSRDQERKVHSRLNQILTVHKILGQVHRRKAHDREVLMQQHDTTIDGVEHEELQHRATIDEVEHECPHSQHTDIDAFAPNQVRPILSAPAPLFPCLAIDAAPARAPAEQQGAQGIAFRMREHRCGI